ncbi:hypothetical protein Aperf_G00000114195 [Anoplocephala perfoliata]
MNSPPTLPGARMQYSRPLIHLFTPNGEKYKCTISPSPGFSPIADAEQLKEAMRGLGTDEDAIINILGNRTSYERLAIRDAYASVSSKTFEEALKGELSGNFAKLALLLIKSPYEIMAKALFNAMNRLATKERVLTEILACISKGEIDDLKKAYAKVSGGKTLEDSIKDATRGHYQEALLLVLAGKSDEPSSQLLKNLSPENIHEAVNLSLAEIDAREIYDAGEGRLGTSESRFMRPIINRSFLQLSATNDAYKRKYGKSLIDAVKKEGFRGLEDFLLTRVRYAIDRAALFSELLYFSMRGPGTRDSTLQRILALRADTDLGSIKEKYEELYGKSLADAIKGDTSGDYQALCLKLIGSA